MIAADVGQPVNTSHMNDFLPGLDAVLDAVIDHARPEERTIRDAQGHWWSLRVRPYLTLEKKIDGAVLMLLDVDELMRREEVIATSRDRLRKWEQIFEHVGWAVATTQPDHGLLDLVNPAFARMHGYTVHELSGRSLSELLAPVSRAELSSIARRADDRGNFVYESVHLRKDGTEFPVLTHVTSLHGQDGSTLYQAATFQDISERKQLEQDLQRRNDELAEADSAKNHFISVLSHELRSPLNVVLLWSHIMQRPECSAADTLTGLTCIDESSRAQSQLIEDLMDVQRISTGRVRLELTPVDLRAIAQSIVEATLPASKGHGLRLELLGDSGPVQVSGDAARLGQVLRNLLDNALKFTPRSGSVGVDVNRKAGRAVLIVSDTGQGIGVEALPHIFDRFRRPDMSPGTGHHGLGLGLSIAKQLVELHGGSITAASPGEGHGATFTISLPLLPLATSSPVIPSSPDGNVSLGGVKVLVFDDEFDQRLPIGKILMHAGAEVVSVASASEALASLQDGLPDVILSDIGMPEQNGYDLLRSIRALPSKGGGRIPAIALTAYGGPEDRERAIDAGFRIHLAKPVESAVLLAAVAELARGPGTQKSSSRAPGA
jgi:two-component system CheB/CheR fusion protein